MIKFCGLYSSSRGNSIFLKSDKSSILIDAGLSGSKIIEALCSIDVDPSEIDAIVITHEHSDHIQGAGILSRRFDIPIYANCKTWDAMTPLLGNIAIKNIQCFKTGQEFYIDDICVKPFKTPHDAAESVGFNFFVDNKKITVATDIGYIFDELYEAVEGSDLVLLESNHDVDMLMAGRYPWSLKKRILSDHGHLSNMSAGEVIAKIAIKGTTKFLLGHLSEENNFPELAYQTVANILNENNIKPGIDVTLDVLPRCNPGKVIGF